MDLKQPTSHDRNLSRHITDLKKNDHFKSVYVVSIDVHMRLKHITHHYCLNYRIRLLGRYRATKPRV